MLIHFYQDKSFPYGMAAAKRRLCYIKGLKAAGDDVNVIICNKVFEKGEDDGMPAKGKYNGTPFCYVSGKYKHPKWNKLMRGLDWNLLDPIRTFFYSLRHIHKGDTVYVYLYPLFLQALILLAAKIKGAKTIKEVCEHPGSLGKKHKLRCIKDWIDYHLIMPLYDGFIAISTDLETFVNKYKKRSAKVIRIPILVDPEPYDIDYSGMQSPFDVPYIIHTGTMHEQKDSISKILHAFARLKREYPSPCKLVFTGKQADAQKCKYKKRIEQLGLTDDIVLMGYVSDEEILRLQHFAALSIIYKSDNLQTRNCFPTKLGEMLMSRVPVIITTIGDSKLYLESGVSAYLFDENDDSQLVNCMQEILSNPQEASAIAKRGQEVALQSFNPIVQGKRLSDFIHSFEP
ncbi:MAG: glycosyltransferase [Bacteroidaceae bacterium]|nr:glycosyltransferase [Bacteroidaceae bacterium]